MKFKNKIIELPIIEIVLGMVLSLLVITYEERKQITLKLHKIWGTVFVFSHLVFHNFVQVC